MNPILRRLKQFSKPHSIHLEAQHIPEVQKATFEYAIVYRPVMFCLTPVNENYVKEFFRNKIDWDSVVKAYNQYQSMALSLNVHLHFSRLPNVLSVKEKLMQVNEASNWLFQNCHVKSKMLCIGWFNKEDGIRDDTVGMKVVKLTDFRVVHDYNLIL